MKPRRDMSGAVVRPMTSDVRSDILGWTVIIFLRFIEGAAAGWLGERPSASNTPPRTLLHRRDRNGRVVAAGRVPASHPQEVPPAQHCGENFASMPQDGHEVYQNPWPIRFRDHSGWWVMGRFPNLVRSGSKLVLEILPSVAATVI